MYLSVTVIFVFLFGSGVSGVVNQLRPYQHSSLSSHALSDDHHQQQHLVYDTTADEYFSSQHQYHHQQIFQPVQELTPHLQLISSTARELSPPHHLESDRLQDHLSTPHLSQDFSLSDTLFYEKTRKRILQASDNLQALSTPQNPFSDSAHDSDTLQGLTPSMVLSYDGQNVHASAWLVSVDVQPVTPPLKICAVDWKVKYVNATVHVAQHITVTKTNAHTNVNVVTISETSNVYFYVDQLVTVTPLRNVFVSTHYQIVNVDVPLQMSSAVEVTATVTHTNVSIVTYYVTDYVTNMHTSYSTQTVYHSVTAVTTSLFQNLKTVTLQKPSMSYLTKDSIVKETVTRRIPVPVSQFKTVYMSTFQPTYVNTFRKVITHTVCPLRANRNRLNHL